MKKFTIPKPLEDKSFIGGWQMENDSICQSLIEFFENNPTLHVKGESYNGLDKDIKDSIDIPLNPLDLKKDGYSVFNKYMVHLNECYWDYLKSFKLEKQFKDVHIGPFNLQKYNPGGHFKSWHSERMNIVSSSRIFAFMTYLNNVNDGGETEFYYFGIKIKPVQGLTLIWPSEWTHLHKGSITNETKYIITGWINFPDDIEGV